MANPAIGFPSVSRTVPESVVPLCAIQGADAMKEITITTPKRYVIYAKFR